MENNEMPHIVMIPNIGIGHLNPMIGLANSLLSHHALTISFITISGQVPASAITKLPENPNFNCISLPPVDTSDISPPPKPITGMSVVMKRSLEHLRNVLPKMQPIRAFVLNMFGADILDVVAELHIPTYIFFTSSAATLSLMLYLPVLHEEIQGEYKELKDMLKVPGCPSFEGTELIDAMQDRQDVEYWWLLHHCRRYREVTGIMINTIDELEAQSVGALLQGEVYGGRIPPVYPIGPIVKIADHGNNSEETSPEDCLKWLDKQPRGSVLFVCLGSGGTLTQKQFVELAWGLETSGHRFLWVTRKPQEVAHGAFFDRKEVQENDATSFLPEGFKKRTAEVGMVVLEWVPQVKVLSHEAVGGFLSHCGWNSTLESITHGVPMIAWPLYAEQRMNSRMLVEEMGIAVGVSYQKGLVPRVEVARAVRLLMEGEVGKKLREKASELSSAAGRALSEKGSSHQRISQLVENWAKGNISNGSHSVCLEVSQVSEH